MNYNVVLVKDGKADFESKIHFYFIIRTIANTKIRKFVIWIISRHR